MLMKKSNTFKSKINGLKNSKDGFGVLRTKSKDLCKKKLKVVVLDSKTKKIQKLGT
jgi:hypothetical protein